MNVNMRKRHGGHGGHGGNMQGGGGRRPQQKYGKPYNNYNNNGQRPRKNFGALREKYLNQAKEALSQGDRVLAEYYFQHADHYYRMMMEYAEQKRTWQEQNPGATPAAENEGEAEGETENPGTPSDEEPDVDIPNNSNVLPAFLTRKVEAPQDGENKVIPIQNWEEEN